MISRHVDLIAIGILLAAIAMFSGAKQVVVLTMFGPVHYLRVDPNHQVRLPAIPDIPPAPRVPRMPRIALQND